jgi:putative endonuclease
MYHGRIDPWRVTPLAASTDRTRARRGRSSWHSGSAAEDAVARRYQAMGATVLHRRLRTPGGELDLVLEKDGRTIFVEVKRCRAGDDRPVSQRQWGRLANAALHYMMRAQNETGVQPVCRFDVALAGPDGQLRIIENARSFDEH